MPIETIIFNGRKYPKLQSKGWASRWIFPFAQELCHGKGLDIGCGKLEWAFANAYPVDSSFGNKYDAMNLPEGEFDYIFSSHMLEHYKGSWVDVLEYWHSKLKPGGVLFLYLPGPGQSYWKSWSNRKHVHNFTPELMREYMLGCGLWTNWFVTGEDLNNSFVVVGERI